MTKVPTRKFFVNSHLVSWSLLLSSPIQAMLRLFQQDIFQHRVLVGFCVECSILLIHWDWRHLVYDVLKVLGLLLFFQFYQTRLQSNWVFYFCELLEFVLWWLQFKSQWFHVVVVQDLIFLFQVALIQAFVDQLAQQANLQFTKEQLQPIFSWRSQLVFKFAQS